MNSTFSKTPALKNLLLMLGFGLLSFILGMIKFNVPGMEGGGSDMREIGVLMGIIFLPHWLYIIGVSILASLNPPFSHIEVSTLLMHLIASLFAWLTYNIINKRVKNVYTLSIYWAVMVFTYYLVFLIPTLLMVFYFYGLIAGSSISGKYISILYAFRFEIFAAVSVTTLFLILYKTTLILKIKNKELEQALKKADESEQLKSAFLANISHEIRTPLFGIVGFANLISDPDLNKEQRSSYGNVIVSSGRQLLSIVSNILDLSKLETGQEEVRISKVEVNELFETLEIFYSSLADEKKLQFEVVIPPENVNDVIYTDRGKLQQILDNLISNAFKFTNSGKVQISYEKSLQFAIFKVEDTGVGIAPDLQPRIFERFSKFELDSDAKRPGTGLGLSICKGLIILLGGEIKVESELGKGSCFSVLIPVNMNNKK